MSSTSCCSALGLDWTPLLSLQLVVLQNDQLAALSCRRIAGVSVDGAATSFLDVRPRGHSSFSEITRRPDSDLRRRRTLPQANIQFVIKNFGSAYCRPGLLFSTGLNEGRPGGCFSSRASPLRGDAPGHDYIREDPVLEPLLEEVLHGGIVNHQLLSLRTAAPARIRRGMRYDRPPLPGSSLQMPADQQLSTPSTRPCPYGVAS